MGSHQGHHVAQEARAKQSCQIHQSPHQGSVTLPDLPQSHRVLGTQQKSCQVYQTYFIGLDDRERP